jgi:peptide methionine sulfoxide reductase MsrB
MERIEVLCKRCDSHLGTFLMTGQLTGTRYCMNSVSLDFEINKLLATNAQIFSIIRVFVAKKLKINV